MAEKLTGSTAGKTSKISLALIWSGIKSPLEVWFLKGY